MASGWRVIDQRQTEELSPQGTFTAVVRVTFQLDTGTIGSVTIPARLYTPEYVQEHVAQAAQAMHAVNSLTGQVQ